MSSRHRKRFRPELRFGFSGPVRIHRADQVSVDDILDSLGRREKLSDKFPETMDLLGVEDGYYQAPVVNNSLGRKIPREMIGRLVFAAMLAVGVLFVWLYGALGAMLDPTSINRLIQNPGVAQVLSDPIRLGVIVFLSLIPLIVVNRRRRTPKRLMRP